MPEVNRNNEVIPSPEQSPYEWILGPGLQHHYVGKTGGQFVHYYDEALGLETTLHIGANEEGELICDSRVKEYARPHKFLGNIAIEEIPTEVLRQALRQSASDTLFLFHKERQRLIKALAAQIPETKHVDIYLPKPLSKEEFGKDPVGARVCLANLRFVLDSVFDRPASFTYIKKRTQKS